MCDTFVPPTGASQHSPSKVEASQHIDHEQCHRHSESIRILCCDAAAAEVQKTVTMNIASHLAQRDSESIQAFVSTVIDKLGAYKISALRREGPARGGLESCLRNIYKSTGLHVDGLHEKLRMIFEYIAPAAVSVDPKTGKVTGLAPEDWRKALIESLQEHDSGLLQAMTFALNGIIDVADLKIQLTLSDGEQRRKARLEKDDEDHHAERKGAKLVLARINDLLKRANQPKDKCEQEKKQLEKKHQKEIHRLAAEFHARAEMRFQEEKTKLTPRMEEVEHKARLYDKEIAESQP